MFSGVVGLPLYDLSRKLNSLERLTEGGDSPVSEIDESIRKYLSRTGHEEPCLNLGGPSSKAKYYLLTDSEQVP